MKQLYQLNDIFPAWAQGNNGFVSLLETVGVVPWNPTTLPIGYLLDLEYHGNHSGEKFISPLLRKMLVDGELPALSATNIALMCGSLFAENWSREWAVLESVYEPIENYSMIEEMDDDETVIDYGKVSTNSGKLTHVKSGTENTAINRNETETPNITVTETPATTETITHNTTVTETPNTTETLTHNTTVTDTPATTETITHNTTVTETPATTETITFNTVETESPLTTETVTHNTTVTDTPATNKITETSNFGFDTPDNTPVKTERVEESYTTGSNTQTATTGTEATAKTGSDTTTKTGTEATAKTGLDTTKTTGTEATAKTGTDTTTTTGTEATAKTGTDTTKTTGTEATAKTGTDTTTTTGSTQTAMIGSDGITYNVTDEDTDTRKTTESGSDTHTRNYKLTRRGNIGVTTSQQMLRSEIDLWMWNFFRNVMFPDIDSVLTLATY